VPGDQGRYFPFETLKDQAMNHHSISFTSWTTSSTPASRFLRGAESTEPFRVKSVHWEQGDGYQKRATWLPLPTRQLAGFFLGARIRLVEICLLFAYQKATFEGGLSTCFSWCPQSESNQRLMITNQLHDLHATGASCFNLMHYSGTRRRRYYPRHALSGVTGFCLNKCRLDGQRAPRAARVSPLGKHMTFNPSTP
jgi:hypothetical protein